MPDLLNKIRYRLNYFRELVVHTPNYGWIIALSSLAGFLNFLGLPALIPVLDYLQKGESTASSSKILPVIERVFQYVGIEPGFYSVLTVAAVCILLGEMLLAVSTLVALFASFRLIEGYSRKVLDLYTKVDWKWLVSSNSGEVNYVVVRETEWAAASHLNAQRVVISAIQCLVYFALAVKLSPASVLLAVGVYSCLAIANIANASAIRQIMHLYNTTNKKLSATVAGLQQNKKFLKTSLLNSRLIETINADLSAISGFYRRSGVRTQLQYSWNFAAMFIFLILLILFNKQLGFNYSSLLVLILVFNRLAPQFNALSASYAALNNYLPMHKALKQRLAEMQSNLERSGNRPFNPEETIRFKEVGFSYHSDFPVLDAVSMAIEPRKTTAIVGKSGSGKTTLLDLLLGLHKPAEGTIEYGQATHEDIDFGSLRKRIAYISQQPTMFDGTVRENLLIGRPDAPDDVLMDICRKTHMDEFIAKLSSGLDTYIGENGVKLSGGQKQRLVLGRALLMKPSMLILDEATSELDLESEKMIQETIRELSRELTIIIVAHRLSTVRHADMIYVLDMGKVCESGTYADLLERKGKLYFLDSLQK